MIKNLIFFLHTILLLNFTVKSRSKEAYLAILLTFAVILSVPLQGAAASSKSPYDPGYDHGCDDAGISNPSDRYIDQPEKGSSFHTSEFMNGYDSGFSSCSGDKNEYHSDNEIEQNPSVNSGSSQDLNTLIRQFCTEVNNGDYDAAIPIAAMAGLSSHAMAIKGGCAVIGFLDYISSNSNR